MNPVDSPKENPMGYVPMKKLILLTSIPLMLSLLINSLYNFVDSIFVSRVSEDALAALSLVSPIQTLVSALGLGNAVGLNAVISKALGERRPEKVCKAADASIFIALCSWISQNELSSVNEYESFVLGFRLGARFMLEVMEEMDVPFVDD